VGRRRQGHDVGWREVKQCGVGRHGVGSCGVGRATRGSAARGRESRCRSGSMGSSGWRGVGQVSKQGGRAHGQSVECVGVG
jgi:hypothetical protein